MGVRITIYTGRAGEYQKLEDVLLPHVNGQLRLCSEAANYIRDNDLGDTEYGSTTDQKHIASILCFHYGWVLAHEYVKEFGISYITWN